MCGRKLKQLSALSVLYCLLFFSPFCFSCFAEVKLTDEEAEQILTEIEESKKVVEGMRRLGVDGRLRYEWINGASHGDLARYFYLVSTYDWLFMHTLIEPRRPVDTSIQITADEKANAYKQIKRRKGELRIE